MKQFPLQIPILLKKYTATNPNTTSPEETFTFTAVATNVKNAGVNAAGNAITAADAPQLTIEAAAYGSGDATANNNIKEAVGDGQYVYSEPVWWAGGSR